MQNAVAQHAMVALTDLQTHTKVQGVSGKPGGRYALVPVSDVTEVNDGDTHSIQGVEGGKENIPAAQADSLQV